MRGFIYVVLLPLFIVYLMGVYIGGAFDPMTWTQDGRVFQMIFSTVAVLIAALLYYNWRSEE